MPPPTDDDLTEARREATEAQLIADKLGEVAADARRKAKARWAHVDYLVMEREQLTIDDA